MNGYSAILELSEILKDRKIQHTLKQLFDGYQITFSWTQADVVEHFGSYGSKQDLMEIMGFLTEEEENGDDSVVGHLSVTEVLERILIEYTKS